MRVGFDRLVFRSGAARMDPGPPIRPVAPFRGTYFDSTSRFCVRTLVVENERRINASTNPRLPDAVAARPLRQDIS